MFKSFIRKCALFLVACIPVTTNAQTFDNGNYTLARDTAGIIVTSSKYGSWRSLGILGGGSQSKVNRLSFEFTTNNYFSESNGGHFAIGLQGKWDGGLYLYGRGVVIGNVSALQDRGRCSPAPQGARVVIESFYGYWTNCVFGNSTASIRLVNGEKYKIEIVSKGRLLSYTLQQKIDDRWKEVSYASVYDPEGNVMYGNNWWVTEVFSNPGWSMQFNSVVEVVE